MFKHQTRADKAILTTNGIILTLIVFAILIPLIYVILASFTNPATLLNSGITLNPSKWTLQGYLRVFKDGSLLIGFRNSLFYSTAFSIISVTITLFAAYPLSRKDFVGRKLMMTLFIITMFFGGGLIPTYLLVKNLNMLDTIWAILLPGAVNVWNIILARAYFQGIPDELREAAIVDGTSEIQFFFKILLPLSKPIIAVLVLYQFVAQWNSYFDAMIYLKSENLQPLQIVLRSILVQMQPRPGMIQDAQNTAQLQQIAEMVKYSSIVISSLPLIIIYPFFQKYFEKGVMVGSIKG
ncbi:MULTISPECIES: carbohydrate ABC transporter permease [Neobacillus]|jgi:putative aldouronate transport system permease protein|uniref:carbohydrate ABC transporter permease n=1 Tax=Neobacillus TaxID=2675232 RepID=UPI0019642D5C|nr:MULTISPECIES: carbohydrate ABC transporter permease [Neobacillus]MBM7650820.1 putative aldouronate transport system permease protein [Neobacillus cucumis]MDR4945539.1 carbohydrate ABC transporter permease [Neobacillus cucumis]MED4227306.1 carbohydrate ABC transporter permease [Neobacillus cucumis]ULT57743.1 carbohydrate ABC transporter permease [Neobacillus drentensis]